MNTNQPAVQTASSAVIERVKKLLALSTSDNPNERDQALAKANALIAEHQIDMVLLEGDDSKPEAFDEVEIVHGLRLPVETKFIGWLIGEHFRVQTINSNKCIREAVYIDGCHVSNSVWGKVRRYVGRKSDVEFARWLHDYLLEEFRRRWAYYKNAHNAPAGDRNTFIYGMYQGLDAKLTEEREKAEETHIEKIAAFIPSSVPVSDGVAQQTELLQRAGHLTEKYQLAVQSEKESLATELARRYPRLSSGRSSRLTIRHGSSSLEAGRATGRNISLNRPLRA